METLQPPDNNDAAHPAVLNIAAVSIDQAADDRGDQPADERYS